MSTDRQKKEKRWILGTVIIGLLAYFAGVLSTPLWHHLPWQQSELKVLPIPPKPVKNLDVSADLTSLAWSPDGKTLATGSFGTVILWDVATEKMRQPLFDPQTPGAPQGAITSLSWSPDGQRLAIAGEDRYIYIWEPTTRKKLQAISAGQGWIYQVAWSPQGDRWAVRGENIALKIWDTDSGKELKTLSGFEGNVASVSWHLDNQNLVVGLRSGEVQLWEAASGKIQQTLGNQKSAVRQVGLSPDGKTLAATSAADLKFWRVEKNPP